MGKWHSPADWLGWKLRAGAASYFRSLVAKIMRNGYLDQDDIAELCAEEMTEDGYYKHD